jgi:hypothetical protein
LAFDCTVSLIARIDERTFASVSGSRRFVDEFKRDSIKLDDDIIMNENEKHNKSITNKNKIFFYSDIYRQSPRLIYFSSLCSKDFVDHIFKFIAMSQKSHLLHSIENNRTANQKSKTLTSNNTQNIGINTDQIQFNQNIGTNTPNYAEQMAKGLANGTAAEEIVQMLMQSKSFSSNSKKNQDFR